MNICLPYLNICEDSQHVLPGCRLAGLLHSPAVLQQGNLVPHLWPLLQPGAGGVDECAAAAAYDNVRRDEDPAPVAGPVPLDDGEVAAVCSQLVARHLLWQAPVEVGSCLRLLHLVDQLRGAVVEAELLVPDDPLAAVRQDVLLVVAVEPEGRPEEPRPTTLIGDPGAVAAAAPGRVGAGQAKSARLAAVAVDALDVLLALTILAVDALGVQAAAGIASAGGLGALQRDTAAAGRILDVAFQTILAIIPRRVITAIL